MSNDILQRFVTGSGGGGSDPLAQASTAAILATPQASPSPGVEDPNTLQSSATLYAVEALCEGEIEGLVNGGQSIFIGDTPLMNADGSTNFAGITYDFRSGLPDQDYMANFSDAEDDTAVGVLLMNVAGTATPVVRTVSNLDANRCRVTFAVSALIVEDLVTGNIHGNSVGVTIDVQADGGSYVQVLSDTITGKTNSNYERAYVFNLDGTGPWNIKVQRTTPQATDSSTKSDAYWSRYTDIVDAKLIYPDTALVGLAVDSALFGSSIPTRSYEIKGLKIQIPSNYDPIAKTYSGVWDGTFQTAWSDNPAWVLYDILTNKRYGMGQQVADLDIDKFSLYSIAQYCDEDVNGAPRFTFNGCIQSQDEAFTIAQSIASNFRGMLFWASEGVMAAVQDAPQDAVAIFSEANVIDGMFSYAGSALNARHSVAFVTWNDPQQGYIAVIEVVENPKLLDAYGYRQLDVVAYGCTSRIQANRLGRWMLDVEDSESETVSFSVGLADSRLRPGSIIKVQDPHYAAIRFGGRLAAVTDASNLTLDAAVSLEVGKTYTIDIILPNGDIGTSNITNNPGSTATIALSTPLAATPDVNTMWVITSNALQPRLFRVLSLIEKDGIQYDVTALLYDITKYDRIEQSIVLPAGTFTNLTNGVLAAPTNLTALNYLARSAGAVQSALLLSWQPSSDPRASRYTVEAKAPGEDYTLRGTTLGVTLVLQPVADGTWSFRIKALDSLNNASPYLLLENITLNAENIPPDNVTGFSISTSGDTSTLRWVPVTSLNLDHYEIRYSNTTNGSATWNNSTVLLSNVAGKAASATIQSRDGTYLIKGVTAPTPTLVMGAYSSAPDVVSTTVNSLLTFNFVADVTEDPSFAGGNFQTVITADTLLLDTNGTNPDTGVVTYYPNGIYTFANDFDLGDVFSCRLSANISANGLNSASDSDTWSNVDLIADVDEVNESEWGIQPQVRFTSDDPTISMPTWSDWVNLDLSDHAARAFQFRVQLFSLQESVTPEITALTITVDMPDTTQSANDITTDSGSDATVITFAKAFKSSSPAIAISTHDGEQGDYYKITLKSASGFSIQFFDIGASSVVRTFDYVAKGYGSVIT